MMEWNGAEGKEWVGGEEGNGQRATRGRNKGDWGGGMAEKGGQVKRKGVAWCQP